MNRTNSSVQYKNATKHLFCPKFYSSQRINKSSLEKDLIIYCKFIKCEWFVLPFSSPNFNRETGKWLSYTSGKDVLPISPFNTSSKMFFIAIIFFYHRFRLHILRRQRRRLSTIHLHWKGLCMIHHRNWCTDPEHTGLDYMDLKKKEKTWTKNCTGENQITDTLFKAWS